MDISLVHSFLFPILAGFVLLTKTPPYKFIYESRHYNKLILDSALYGVLLLFGWYYFIFILSFIFSFFNLSYLSAIPNGFVVPLKNTLVDIFQDEKIIGNISYPLGALLVSLSYLAYFEIWKRVRPYTYKVYEVNCRLEAKPSDLESLMIHSFQNYTPIMITLKSRKVYIGMVTKYHNASNLEERKFFSILPIASGFRDEETLSLEIQNKYEWGILSEKLHFSDNEKEDLRKALSVSMVLKIDDVLSATVWLPSVYEYFSQQPCVTSNGGV